MPGRQYTATTSYRYGFNGKENDNEVKGQGSSLDFGARVYDPRLGRWLSTDPLQKKYPHVSPFVFSLNTPIGAMDPDGKLVIFINGQHTGEGGTAAYWGGYDKKAMDAMGDHNARYVDGALGGFANTTAAYNRGYNSTRWWEYVGQKGFAAQETVRIRNGINAILDESNVNRTVREQAGYAQGLQDVNSIFGNLTDGESIKLVTHSMGAAFSRGYIKAIKEYMKEFKITNHKIELVVDVNAFQGAELSASGGETKTLNKTGGNDGKSIFGALWYAIKGKGISVPTVGQVKGAQDITAPEEQANSHEIGKMGVRGIPNVGNAGSHDPRAVPVEQGSNNGQSVKKEK